MRRGDGALRRLSGNDCVAESEEHRIPRKRIGGVRRENEAMRENWVHYKVISAM